MRKRTIFMILIILTSIIVQLFGIPYLGIKFSSNDLEFDFIYNWDLIGTGGWYEGYTENYISTGSYIVEFNGEIASVTGSVSWRWSENYYHTSDSATELHSFTYSLINGTYLTGTDQDYDTTNMTVWFHIPGGITGASYDILDTSYDVIGDSIIWFGYLMPFTGKNLHSEGIYARDDVYGQFSANYRVDDFFTAEGYLIGEIYTEQDEGYDKDTGYWSEFTLNSILFITASSYFKGFNFGMYFLAYWGPILLFLILLFVVYENLRWKPRVISKNLIEREIIIECNLPKDAAFEINSAYSGVISSYLVRAKAQGKRIICAHDQKSIIGIGFVEPNGKIGTFYGKYNAEMIKYSKVKYAFTESGRIFGFKTIEIYDIFQIENLQNRNFTYDTLHIKPTIPQYLTGIMKMIANEDSGKAKPRYAKWVQKSYEDDISVVSIANRQERWIQSIITDLYRHNYPKPEMIDSEVIMGAGFATPGEETGWLYGLYVHPAFRNHGLGRMLVLSRLSALKEMGCGTAITEIAEWNSPAKNIYDDLNAQNIGKINLLGKKMPKVKVRRY